jgi:hypothetical protein
VKKNTRSEEKQQQASASGKQQSEMVEDRGGGRTKGSFRTKILGQPQVYGTKLKAVK